MTDFSSGYFVDSVNGNDSNLGNSESEAWLTWSHALSQIEDPATNGYQPILHASGSFSPSATMRSEMTLYGTWPSDAFIEVQRFGASLTINNSANLSSYDGAYLDLVFRGVDFVSTTHSVIDGNTGCTFVDCTFGARYPCSNVRHGTWATFIRCDVAATNFSHIGEGSIRIIDCVHTGSGVLLLKFNGPGEAIIRGSRFRNINASQTAQRRYGIDSCTFDDATGVNAFEDNILGGCHDCVFRGHSGLVASGKTVPYMENCYAYNVTDLTLDRIKNADVTVLANDPYPDSGSGDWTPSAELIAHMASTGRQIGHVPPPSGGGSVIVIED